MTNLVPTFLVGSLDRVVFQGLSVFVVDNPMKSGSQHFEGKFRKAFQMKDSFLRQIQLNLL